MRIIRTASAAGRLTMFTVLVGCNASSFANGIPVHSESQIKDSQLPKGHVPCIDCPASGASGATRAPLMHQAGPGTILARVGTAPSGVATSAVPASASRGNAAPSETRVKR